MDDCMRNIYITPKNFTGKKPVMMLDAHCDEVGFMVHSIRDNGTIRFVALGGWSLGSLAASKVRVRASDGSWVPGVIANKPVHFMSAAEKTGVAGDISAFSIDVGARSAQEAREVFHIREGEPVVPDVRFEYDNARDVMIAKAFDCRIGCAAVIEVLRRLAEKELPFDVVGVLSSQEEVGERGVRVAINRVKPDIAICFEGCPADDTFTERYAVQTALKKGPMLRFMDKSIICSPRYQRYCLDLAQEKGLPVQASVREGGGNNGAMIHNALLGVPVVVMGVPVRYIHAHHGISSYFDFESTVRLAQAVTESMTKEVLASF